MKFEIPHDLGAAEAKRRLEKQLPKLDKHIPGGGTAEAVWTSDHAVTLKVKALGQTIGAAVEVEETLVRADVSVPMMLSMMSGPIRDFIEKSLRSMLEKGGKRPPAESA